MAKAGNSPASNLFVQECVQVSISVASWRWHFARIVGGHEINSIGYGGQFRNRQNDRVPAGSLWIRRGDQLSGGGKLCRASRRRIAEAWQSRHQRLRGRWHFHGCGRNV